MSVKKRIAVWAVCTAIVLAASYTGISCVATLCRAETQPHLMAGTVQYDFIGYYMMAAVMGGICVLCIVAVIVLMIVMRGSIRKDSSVKREDS